MFEGESEGIARLTAYLQQTKRQAENSIDKMNQHIDELQEDLETSKLVSRQLEQERDYFRNLAEQLKEENTKKWRLQERDDWKALLESVQEDRERLQEDCNRLESQLELAKQLMSPDDLQVFEETTGTSTSVRTVPEGRASITRSPPRQSNEHSSVGRNLRTEETMERSDNEEASHVGTQSGMMEEPLSRSEPPDYSWPLSLIFRKSSMRGQVYYI